MPLNLLNRCRQNQDKELNLSTLDDVDYSIYSLDSTEVSSSPLKKVLVLNSTEIAIATINDTIEIWSIAEEKFIKGFIGPKSTIENFIIHENNLLIATSKDRMIHIWNKTTDEYFTLSGHFDDVTVVASLSSSKIMTASNDYTIRVWNLETKKCEYVFPILLEKHIHSLAKLSNVLIMYAQWGALQIWDINDSENPSCIFKYNDTPSLIEKALILDDGSLAILENNMIPYIGGNTIKIFHPPFQKYPSIIFRSHPKKIIDVIQLSNQYLMTLSADNILRILDLFSGISRDLPHDKNRVYTSLNFISDMELLLGQGNAWYKPLANPQLTKLTFTQRCPFDLYTIRNLFLELETDSLITSLILDNCKLTDEGIKELINLLKINKNISSISLNNTDITDAGALLILAALNSKIIKLDRINLESNNVSDELIGYIDEAIVNVSLHAGSGIIIEPQGVLKINEESERVSFVPDFYKDELSFNDVSIIQEDKDLDFSIANALPKPTIYEVNKFNDFIESLRCVDRLHLNHYFLDSYLITMNLQHANLTKIHSNIYSLVALTENTIAIGTSAGEIQIRDIRTGKLMHTLGQQINTYDLLAVNLSNQRLCSVQKNIISVWDINSGICILTLFTLDRITSLAYDEKSETLAIGYEKGLIDLYDGSRDLKVKASWKAHVLDVPIIGEVNNVRSLAFLPDHKLASASYDGSMKIWDINTCTCLHNTEFENRERILSLIVWQSRYLIGGSDEGLIRIWDLINYNCVSTLSGHKGEIYSLALSSESILISGGADGKVIAWDLIKRVPITSFCSGGNMIYAIATFTNGRVAFGGGHMIKPTDTTLKVMTLFPRLFNEDEIIFILDTLKKQNNILIELFLDELSLNIEHILCLIELIKVKHDTLRIVSLKNVHIHKDALSHLNVQLRTLVEDKGFCFILEILLPDVVVSENKILPLDDGLKKSFKQTCIRAREEGVNADSFIPNMILNHNKKSPIIDSAKPILYASPENTVTVRIWTMGGDRMGHASLETYGEKGIYASFWPRYVKKNGFMNFNALKVKPSFLSYEHDLVNEKGEPDIIIHLYSLDVNAINHAYRIFRVTGYNWSLLGGSIFRLANSHNCCSLVAYLLEKGGVNKLLISYATTASNLSILAYSGITLTRAILAATGLVNVNLSADPSLYESIFGTYADGMNNTKRISYFFGKSIDSASQAVAIPRLLGKLLYDASQEEQKKYHIVGQEELDIKISQYKSLCSVM